MHVLMASTSYRYELNSEATENIGGYLQYRKLRGGGGIFKIVDLFLCNEIGEIFTIGSIWGRFCPVSSFPASSSDWVATRVIM